MAQPAAGAATAAYPLAFAKASGLEVTGTEKWLFVRRQMRTPRAYGSDLFNCGAFHIGEGLAVMLSGAPRSPLMILPRLWRVRSKVSFTDNGLALRAQSCE